MEDARDALDHAVFRRVPSGRVAEEGYVEVREICSGVDGKVVRHGGEDEEGTAEDEGEEDEGDVQPASLRHGGGKRARKCELRK